MIFDALPRLIDVLTTGDFDQDGDVAGDGEPDDGPLGRGRQVDGGLDDTITELGDRDTALPHPDGVHQGACSSRADALEPLEDAEPGELVVGVVQQPQQRHEVLDVGGLKELQAAVLHVGDVAPGELELEEVGVVRRAEQHRLLGRSGRPRRDRCGGAAAGRRAGR